MFLSKHGYRDPAEWVWIKTREGGHWRRKRGTVKKAELNADLARNAQLTAVANGAASKLMRRMWEYLEGLDRGRSFARMAALFRKMFKENRPTSYADLTGFDFQPRHPMEQLLFSNYTISERKGAINIQIPLSAHAVKQHSQLVTGYFFELVMVWGDAAKQKALKMDSVSSDLYDIESDYDDCVLSLDIPTGPWMAVLKLSCVEGKEMAVAPRNYGMKIIKGS